MNEFRYYQSDGSVRIIGRPDFVLRMASAAVRLEKPALCDLCKTALPADPEEVVAFGVWVDSHWTIAHIGCIPLGLEDECLKHADASQVSTALANLGLEMTEL
jgi:hypothetical protein